MRYFIMVLLLIFSTISFAAKRVVIIDLETQQNIGSVTLKDTEYGLLLIPKLQQLSPGLHGFHLHQNPSCAEKGKAAGGHFDPQDTKQHLGPYAKGHLGDLPALYVNQQGLATLPILAPRLKLQDMLEHALIIHAGGENYSDIPSPLGGGMNRIACGVVK